MLVDLKRLPRHVAVIMDGNGRWAQRLHRPRTEGHREGAQAVRRIVRACRRLGVDALTLYAFSEQNWARPALEVRLLMGLLIEFLRSERQELLDTNIRFRAIGRLDKLPPEVRVAVDEMAAQSASNTGMTLSIALSYGGREEIADAARTLANKAVRGEIALGQIDERSLERQLASFDVGAVDLLIRTGGERRISNFLLWSAAYAELHFSDKLWPEYSESDLYQAVADYQRRERRFGRVLGDETDDPAPSKPAARAS